MKILPPFTLALSLSIGSVCSADGQSTNIRESISLMSGTFAVALPEQHDEIEMLFATGSISLSEAAKAAIKPLIRRVKYSPTMLTVTGYSDVRGSKNGNLVLSLNRAKTVRDFLIDHGVRPENIRIDAHGESRATVNIQQTEQLVADRRVVVTARHLKNRTSLTRSKADTLVYAGADNLP